jgi:hypothetical protein
MGKRKRHLKAVPTASERSRRRDEPVKLPDDFGEAIRRVMPVQATKASESDEDAR